MRILHFWMWRMLASLGLLTAGLSVPILAEEPPLAEYGVDLVSDYVDRGEDVYRRRFDKARERHGAVNVAPAVQPSLTLSGPSGISLKLWGSFALRERDDDNPRGFLGLGRDDKLEYTLAFDWSNQLGGFTAALIQATYLDACHGAEVPCTAAAPEPDPVPPELLIRWAAPFAKAIHPALSYYASPAPGAWYAALELSGGERVFWAASLGAVAQGPNDLTIKLGYTFGDFKVSLDGAYRPNAELVGYPIRDEDGNRIMDDEDKPLRRGEYLTAKGEVARYAPVIFWFTLSYAGSIAAQ